MFLCDKCNKEFKTELLKTKHLERKPPCKKPYPKPILKWVGGKSQLLDKLLENFPKLFDNYHEIFIGGGSVLFGFLQLIKEGSITISGKIYAYDLNEPLINIYKNIQSNPSKLYEILQSLISDYTSCINGNGNLNRKPKTIEEAKQLKENYYYWVRSQYNKMTISEKNSLAGSAAFIFLNKTCFRGVFRIGPNGYNVPYGHYDNPEIINEAHLYEIHELIKDVIFECCDFETPLTNNIQENDFVYLDPPYAPETETSFVGYTENGFGIEKHEQLFKLCNKLNNLNKKFMMSNSDVKLVRDNFAEDKYSIESILCKRAINSKEPGSKAKEVIIMN